MQYSPQNNKIRFVRKMNKPELYVKENFLARESAIYVINTNLELLEASDNDAVLDVGCGPGNITYEKILPILPNTTKKLIGIDISLEFVEYARKHYQGDSRVSYQQMDITKDEIPNEYASTFDLIISLYCLHFLNDQKKALINMYKMLKPGGRILISFVRKYPLNDVYYSLYKNSKWTKYMSNIDEVVAGENSIDYYRALLEEIGFTQIKHEDRKVDSFHSEEGGSRLLRSVNSFKVPQSLEKEFIQDHFNVYRQAGYASVNNFGEEVFHFPYITLIISASKISNI